LTVNAKATAQAMVGHMQALNGPLKLGIALFPGGGHVAAWRHGDYPADRGLTFQHFVEATVLAEQGKLDFVFIADSSAIRGSENLLSVRRQAHAASFEPVTLLAALAGVTRHIGLVATASTSFYQPYTVARQFASLDLLSGGRAGWNLVTSAQDVEAQNHGADKLPPHDERYAQASEFADVVLGLWDGWDEDAIIADAGSGIYFDPEKVHLLNHKGPHYSVRGPLNVARSAQGRPVLVQAGSSDAGRDLAARTAEIIFTAQRDLASARGFCTALRSRAALFGRGPHDMLILPGVSVIIGETPKDAQRKRNDLAALVHSEVALSLLRAVIGGFDFSKFPIDGPVPDIPETNGPRSRQQLLIDLARREKLTIRELGAVVAESQGHRVLAGSPKEIADDFEEWHASGGADGFIVTPPLLPGGLRDLVTLLIPELQRRGLFRREYEDSTLRGNLGLPRHRSGYATAPMTRRGTHQ
jgi:N-acetyl-S-(2-succino)cysteine monooxygenase